MGIDLGEGRWDQSYLVVWPCEEGYSLQRMEGDLFEGPLSKGVEYGSGERREERG